MSNEKEPKKEQAETIRNRFGVFDGQFRLTSFETKEEALSWIEEEKKYNEQRGKSTLALRIDKAYPPGSWLILARDGKIITSDFNSREEAEGWLASKEGQESAD